MEAAVCLAVLGTVLLFIGLCAYMEKKIKPARWLLAIGSIFFAPFVLKLFKYAILG